MSDAIKHECGIALVRLLKPFDFYKEKYGTYLYGLNKLYLLMEKQHNRGQDGAGLAGVKLNMPPGGNYIFRYRENRSNPIGRLFAYIKDQVEKVEATHPEAFESEEALKKYLPVASELLLGHLRYATHGNNDRNRCHPVKRSNNWESRNLVLAGNFNMTNNDELMRLLVQLGQHPTDTSDTVTVLEKFGHFLDEEVEELFRRYKDAGHNQKKISELIADNIRVERVLTRAAKDFDGGYALAGMIGHGDAFVIRDPNGIRPVHYYADDEIVVVTSERPPIQTAFNIPAEEIKEIKPGHALIIKHHGEVSEKQILKPREKKSCSFERIYFSRGSDKDIYRERKELGRLLAPKVLEAINYDIKNTVFSYVPNTAETAFIGLMDGVDDYLAENRKSKLKEMTALGEIELNGLLDLRPRIEKIAVKDAKLRTFITADAARNDLVTHVYDTTYGVINRGKDTLVILDDSIVRGTTLKESILRILDRLGPKKIIIVSSAPQIRYPDCYGIDMSKLQDFAAFRAAIALIKENQMDDLLEDVYGRCKSRDELPSSQLQNHVKRLYDPFTAEQISDKITELLKPATINAEVQIIYQSIENLHKAIPEHSGDWYFTGNFPTPGGHKVVNKAFMNYYEGKNVRAY